MGQGMRTLVGQYWSVFKLRIAFAIMLCSIAGAAAAQGPAPSAWKMSVLALAVLLSAASAGAFNHYVERDLDARMARTRARPFVTGAFKAGPLWLAAIVGLLALAVGAAAWLVNPWVALYVFLGAFVYGVVYTVWLKRRTWLNIVLGGLAGSFAVLAGAAAVNPALGPVPVILAVVLFLWTPPHFWSLATVLQDEYAEAGVPMLPVVAGEAATARAIFAHTVALVALSLVPAALGLGWIYLLGAAAGGALFIHRSARLLREPGRDAARATFLASLAQLGLLLGATILDRLLLG
jgi:protoheme IX farnesyltransferase